MVLGSNGLSHRSRLGNEKLQYHDGKETMERLERNDLSLGEDHNPTAQGGSQSHCVKRITIPLRKEDHNPTA